MPLFKSQLLDAAHKTLIDEVDLTTTYIGDTDIGATTSSSVWMIRRLTATGNNLAVEYANGSPSFDKVWDSRTSYPYS